MRRTLLTPEDEGLAVQLGGILFPGWLRVLRPCGQEVLRRVVHKAALRYRKDVERAWLFR